MKTVAKVFGGLFLLMVLAIAAISIYVKFFFDPNDLRAQITKQVKERTGRDLVIEGDFALSTFPWVTIDVGKTHLSDDPRFNNQTLLSFEHASASIKLMPLLKKQIELGTTTIDGAQVNLVRSADGVNNWDAFLQQFFSQSSKDPTSDPATESAPDAATDLTTEQGTAEKSSGFATQSLGAINISDARVSYTDQSTNDSMVLDGFNLSTGQLVPEQPFDVDLSTGLTGTNVNLQGVLSGVATLGTGTLKLGQPVIALSGNHYAVPFSEFKIDVNGRDIHIDDSSYRIAKPNISWSVSGGRETADTVAQGHGALSATHMTLVGETLDLETLSLDFDTQMTNSPMQRVKGQLSATQFSLAAQKLAADTLALDFDAQLQEGAARRVNGLLSAAKLSGQVDNLVLNSPVLSFDSALTLNEVSTVKGDLKGKRLTLKKMERIALTEASFNGHVSGSNSSSGFIGQNESINVSSELLAFNLDNSTLRLNHYDAALFDMNISGSVRGKDVLGSPTISGPIAIEPFNLRSLLKKAHIQIDTTDPDVLGQTTFKGRLNYSDTAIGLSNLRATLDQSEISGKAAIENGIQVVDLNIDRLDVDRYLAPPAQENNQTRAVDEIEIPAQMLRDLKIRGRVQVGQMTFSGIESQNVDINIDANNGAVRVFPAGAALYGGRYAGDIRIDASGEVPKLSLNERFENVDIGAFTNALAQTQHVTGKITGSLVMTATGHSTTDLKATSDGTAEFSIDDGVLQGVNVMETVRNIVAAANKEPGVADEPDRTEFRQLSGSATIDRGVLSNNDLTIEIPLMKIAGAGSLDLNTKAVNYKVGAKVVKEGDVPLEKELRFISDYTLPLYIAGTYEAPVVDKARSISDLLAQHVKKEARDRILDAVGDRLGLGNRDKTPEQSQEQTPEQPTTEGAQPAEEKQEPLTPDEERDRREEEIKDEIDKKIKDKLKDIFGG